MLLRLRAVPALGAALLAALVARGCSSADDAPAADGGSSGFVPAGDGGFAPDCVNPCKQQVTCVEATTAVSGVVRDPAEKLVELMLFDLSSCIQDDRATHGPPSSR